MAEDRSERRKERYQYLRRLGFSPAEARRLRDRSGSNIENFIDNRLDEIVQTPTNLRTPDQREQRESIQEARRIPLNVDNASRGLSQRERQQLYETWSSRTVGFPQWAMDYIQSANMRAGLDPLDGFGFRRFYWRWVQGRVESVAADLADRAETE